MVVFLISSAPEHPGCAPRIVSLLGHLYGLPSVASHLLSSPEPPAHVSRMKWWLCPDTPACGSRSQMVRSGAHRAARMTQHVFRSLRGRKLALYWFLLTHLLWVGDGGACPPRVLVLEAWAHAVFAC